MAKYKSKFVCQDCGYESPKWMGKCPGCGQWNRMVEEVATPAATAPSHAALQHLQSEPAQVTRITEIDIVEEARTHSGYGEFDRVLGGGIVGGSLVLVGGDPGIGKSTLLLQTSNAIAMQGRRVLYVSGEESAKQIKLRADRLGSLSENLLILPETDLERVESHIKLHTPDFLIIDSIQTVYRPGLQSAPGSVGQVRECTAFLLRIAKTLNLATFIVGHVTKEGAIAGPRMLEHMVDAVLYFEGERHHTYRILRGVKNRFGSTNEIGIFEMREKGLEEVVNPSELFLSERPHGVAGSCVVASMEGTRPVLVEIQALVTPSSYGTPRRMATGLDHNRVSLIMAVLEKRMGLYLQSQDAYVNVAGGVRLDEPAVDLGIALALASSFREQLMPPGDVYIGEVGLTGEVRGVSRIEQRVREAMKLGFTRVIVPTKNLRGWQPPAGVSVIGVETVQEAFQVALGG
ncbi:DNA repair protein RadA [Tumebacillus sp. ITR2]|uniref:DNA repair protein RadA n=1 Tax=Tumebacillus amylolyticus TaxID=2801339 RepID=A0ABS1JHZ1_9BACL|nr:DNA repair protein RadA [Tumebacillus amylolyticus]MBL0389443.1 DNA repair protein RadA [Tumebacillus amylolyticus]